MYNLLNLTLSIRVLDQKKLRLQLMKKVMGKRISNKTILLLLISMFLCLIQINPDITFFM